MLVISVDSKEIRDAFKKSPEIVKKHISGAIEKSLFTIEGEAKDKTPVITGRLKGSIGIMKRGELWGKVGTDVEYAPFVEKRRGFMSGGVEASINDIKRFFNEAATNIAKDLEK